MTKENARVKWRQMSCCEISQKKKKLYVCGIEAYQFPLPADSENGFIRNTAGFWFLTSHTDVSMHSALKHGLQHFFKSTCVTITVQNESSESFFSLH